MLGEPTLASVLLRELLVELLHIVDESADVGDGHVLTSLLAAAADKASQGCAV